VKSSSLQKQMLEMLGNALKYKEMLGNAGKCWEMQGTWYIWSLDGIGLDGMVWMVRTHFQGMVVFSRTPFF
jgi:hypothetical protein